MDRQHKDAYKLYVKDCKKYGKTVHPLCFFKTLKNSFHKKYYDKVKNDE